MELLNALEIDDSRWQELLILERDQQRLDDSGETLGREELPKVAEGVDRNQLPAELAANVRSIALECGEPFLELIEDEHKAHRLSLRSSWLRESRLPTQGTVTASSALSYSDGAAWR